MQESVIVYRVPHWTMSCHIFNNSSLKSAIDGPRCQRFQGCPTDFLCGLTIYTKLKSLICYQTSQNFKSFLSLAFHKLVCLKHAGVLRGSFRPFTSTVSVGNDMIKRVSKALGKSNAVPVQFLSPSSDASFLSYYISEIDFYFKFIPL